jgi:phosphoribosylamine---glycine ligase
MSSVCVVIASGGYPGSYSKGKTISGLAAADALPHTKVFHAGTTKSGEQVITSGGRVLGVTALGKDLKSAQKAAYAAVERIQFEGAQNLQGIHQASFSVDANRSTSRFSA